MSRTDKAIELETKWETMMNALEAFVDGVKEVGKKEWLEDPLYVAICSVTSSSMSTSFPDCFSRRQETEHGTQPSREITTLTRKRFTCDKMPEWSVWGYLTNSEPVSGYDLNKYIPMFDTAGMNAISYLVDNRLSEFDEGSLQPEGDDWILDTGYLEDDIERYQPAYFGEMKLWMFMPTTDWAIVDSYGIRTADDSSIARAFYKDSTEMRSFIDVENQTVGR